jgi:inner membrane protein
MEPVTHMLTGAVLSRAGVNRKAAYATVAMVIAAELPDADTLWGFGGPVVGFEHHRGITHTFLATPVEAALVTAAFWAWHRLRKSPKTKAAVNWWVLFFGCWLALLSHLLLDWTNNYGLRPFFPFNPRWYAGSFVFIFEPVMFAILVLALVLPALFGLVGSEVGAKTPQFRGRGWAIAALVGVFLLYCVRYVEHAKAIAIAEQNEPAGTTRVFASPHPGNPFLWSTVSDAPLLYHLADVDTRRNLVLPGAPADTLYKLPVTLPILAAKRTFLGQVYLDWSMYPVITQAADTTDPNHPLVEVTFADARFMYSTVLGDGRTKPALTGTVLLDMAAHEGDRVVEMKMGTRVQK